MESRIYAYILTLGGMTLLLAGCGGGGTTPDKSTALSRSDVCISCHEDPKWATPGTGKSLVAEWKLSSHMTANAASCTDCHDDSTTHLSSPASCSKCHSVAGQTRNPTNNPDRDGKCAKCHDKINPRSGQNDGYNTAIIANGVPAGSTTRFTHFSTGLRANYVSSNNKLHCRNCHNPHDTSFASGQRKAWSESGHGITRGLARIIIDFKTRGTNLPLNVNFGNNSFCVRCHTTTGFINFVDGDQFTNVNALHDIGADGLPSPTGLQTNAPAYTFPRTGPNAGKIVAPDGSIVSYKDKSRELTGCNACHLDIRATDSSSYGGTLRQVAVTTGVKIYYPYSTAGFKTVTPVQFDTLSNSNLCLTCHSGRATGRTISEPGLIAMVVANKKPSAPSIHDFAGGAVLEGEKSAFLFYTSPAKYKTFPAHRALNADGNGPCITCHMPKVPSTQTGGLIHSHLFRPVSWTGDDINQDITEIISNPSVCSGCHNDSFQPSLTPALMNTQLRKGIRVSLLILAKLLPASSNWIGPNTNITPNVTYGTALVPRLGNMPAAVYTMGASFNQGFLFNEPSSYNHSPILARQLIYDSIDWLKNGEAGFGTSTSPANVYSAIKNVPLGAGLLWTKVDVVTTEKTGVSVNKNYATYTTETDRDAAFLWLCKDYVNGSNVCNRW